MHLLIVINYFYRIVMRNKNVGRCTLTAYACENAISYSPLKTVLFYFL